MLQGLIDLTQVLGLLLGFNVLAGQYTELPGCVQQLLAQLPVDAALALQHLVLAGLLRQGGIADGLFRHRLALVIDDGLQQRDVVFNFAYLQGQQVFLLGG